ncbi:uncharacterized protein LOC143485850 isoform X3 [Brachyhypopomus gauderio]|uniref:uncharacterized protein LOC143485850 isoform X3 n=1 Tax=Brachyhypopomus gauderio TaxID=698409 RepID=UPI004042D8A6
MNVFRQISTLQNDKPNRDTKTMPSYKPKSKKGKKKPSNRHHHSSPSSSRGSSPIRVGVLKWHETGTPPEGGRGVEEHQPPQDKTTPTLAQLEGDPVCASLLRHAREHLNPEAAEGLRQEAVRIWRVYHPSSSREPSPLRVNAVELCGLMRDPESELEEGDSPGEESEPDYGGEDCHPSLDDASTVDYGGEDYHPSLDDASTVDYGGEDYPPPAALHLERPPAALYPAEGRQPRLEVERFPQLPISLSS